MEGLDLLVIDDEPLMQRVFTQLLKDASYSYHCVTSAEEGLELLKTQRPALALIDYHMPEINGRDMIIKISEAYLFRTTRFFLYTSEDLSEEDVIKMRTLGFEGVIKKPLTKTALLDLLAESCSLQS